MVVREDEEEDREKVRMRSLNSKRKSSMYAVDYIRGQGLAILPTAGDSQPSSRT